MNTTLHYRANLLEITTVLAFILSQWNKLSHTKSNYEKETLEQLNHSFETLEKSINTERRNTYTKNLKETSEAVWMEYRCIKNLLKGYQLSHKEEKAFAAKKLLRTLQNNTPNFNRLHYLAKNSALQILLEDLNKKENQIYLQTLPGVEEEYIELKKRIETLQSILFQRTESAALKTPQSSAYYQAKKIQKLLNNDILPYIYPKAKSEPENFAEFVSKIRVHIQEMNSTVRNRVKR